MFFPPNTPDATIIHTITQTLAAINRSNGIDITIKPHTKIRTIRQNRFLMQVCSHIVQFYHETGFLPQGLPKWAARTEIVKEFWKGFFGIEYTHKLSTSEIATFIDNIQNEMIQQSQGEYQPLIPDSDYLIALCEN